MVTAGFCFLLLYFFSWKKLRIGILIVFIHFLYIYFRCVGSHKFLKVLFILFYKLITQKALCLYVVIYFYKEMICQKLRSLHKTIENNCLTYCPLIPINFAMILPIKYNFLLEIIKLPRI